jgi:hypothetical protein
MGSVFDVALPMPSTHTPPGAWTGGERTGGGVSFCKGSLVVHKDGTPLFCSEELAGRFCGGGLSYERHRIFRSCGLTFFRGCPECESELASASDVAPALAAVHG